MFKRLILITSLLSCVSLSCMEPASKGVSHFAKTTPDTTTDKQNNNQYMQEIETQKEFQLLDFPNEILSEILVEVMDSDLRPCEFIDQINIKIVNWARVCKKIKNIIYESDAQSILGKFLFPKFGVMKSEFNTKYFSASVSVCKERIKELNKYPLDKFLREIKAVLWGEVLCSYLVDYKIVAFLVEKGANVNYQQKNTSDTPLHIAAERGDEESVKLLLDKGANVFSLNSSQHTADYAAEDKGHKQIAQLIKNKMQELAAQKEQNKN